ncbi:MAG: hypothetical protein QM800_04575 [Paludibacter sp.]
MKKISEKTLFVLIPFVLILLISTSGEVILPVFENTVIENILYLCSIPNSIIFNLCVGYLSGLFIYYLTVYIPNKEREKQEIIITKRLLTQLNSRVQGLFKSIKNCSTVTDIDLKNASKEEFRLMCKACNFNSLSGVKQVINSNPPIIGDITIRDWIVSEWNRILEHLNEIDNAAIYIEPAIYNLCLQIRKCSLSNTIDLLSNVATRNTDFESWSSQFHDLYLLCKDLDYEIVRISKM